MRWSAAFRFRMAAVIHLHTKPRPVRARLYRARTRRIALLGAFLLSHCQGVVWSAIPTQAGRTVLAFTATVLPLAFRGRSILVGTGNTRVLRFPATIGRRPS